MTVLFFPEWLDAGVLTGMTDHDSDNQWENLRRAYNANQLLPLEATMSYSKVDVVMKPNAQGKYNIPWDADKNRRDENFIAQSNAFCQFVVDRWGHEVLIQFAISRRDRDETALKPFGLDSLDVLNRLFKIWLKDKLAK